MYQNWYNTPILQTEAGEPEQLIIRIHFGENYPNAFWNGHSVSLGDGDGIHFYPLAALDVIGHEFVHGFTAQHADLEYHDESGALNESFSDMTGIAVRQYLLEKSRFLYNKIHVVTDEITWMIGESVLSKESSDEALRFMDYPSKDHLSADCLDKNMARKNKGACSVSYNELVMVARSLTRNEEEFQSFLVHTASGIYNRIFYLLSKEFDIKTAYSIMLHTNVAYWTPVTNFKTGACDVIHAANDLNLDLTPVKSVFFKTGIDVSNCL